MVLFRCLSGVFSGSTVTIRTMISEISTPKTQARAFSLFAFSGNISILLAPLMGGILAKPADSFAPFRHVKLFVAYPYLLPCMVTGSLALTAAIINLIFLKEVGHNNLFRLQNAGTKATAFCLVDTNSERQERFGNQKANYEHQGDSGIRRCPSSLIDLSLDFQHRFRVYSM